ncbi:MAG: MFS transporter [Bacteroidetes bacterium]|nr:MFS transporter [Bacteroidota bacterium]
MIGFYIFYNLVYALLSYPAGVLADKLGMKKILVYGLAIFAVVYFFMGFVTSFFVFGLLFFLYALYAASTESIAKAWITNISDKPETATAIGFFTSFSSVLTLFASSFAGLLWFYFSPVVTFVVSGVGVGLVVIFIIFFVNDEKHQSADLE